MNRHRSQLRSTTRRAMTLLEVVLAVLLLSILVVSITGSINMIVAMESRSRQRTNACELANKIILQYLDDEETLPSEALPLDYGKDRYFWKKQDWNVSMSINQKQESAGSALQGLNRYHLVRVTVFESIGPDSSPQPGIALASLDRIFDPASARNPDTISKLDEEGIRKLINDLTGASAPKGTK